MRKIQINRQYLLAENGTCKVAQIIVGATSFSLLCATRHDGANCFDESRIAFCSISVFITAFLNIIFLFVNVLGHNIWGVERIYTALSTVIFLTASLMIVCFAIERQHHDVWLLMATVLTIFLFILFLWDLKIVCGQVAPRSVPVKDTSNRGSTTR